MPAAGENSLQRGGIGSGETHERVGGKGN
jgi:hypothetical protein